MNNTWYIHLKPREYVKKMGAEDLWNISQLKPIVKRLWDKCKENRVICVGWSSLDDLTSKSDKEIHKMIQDEPKYIAEVQKGSTTIYAISKFVNGIKEGDMILVGFSKEVYGIGLAGKYVFRPELIDETVPHLREITWLRLKEYKSNLGNQNTIIPLSHEKLEEFISMNQDDAKDLKDLFNLNSNANFSRPVKPELNTILYGPPGTGKTYQTKDMALKIILEV